MRHVALTAAVYLILAAASVGVAAQTPGDFSIDTSPLPQPTEPVNDFAGVLSRETVDRLNQRIKEFKLRTDPPVVLAVAIVRTTGERDIFDYSLAVARGWKVGTDRDDNPGALLLIAVDDRKYFTQVSRNLEDEMPDGLAGQLQRKHLVPALRQGDYDRGVTDTIEAYIAAITEKTGTVEAASSGSRSAADEFSVSDLCKVGLFILVVIFFIMGGGGKRGGRLLPALLSFGLSGGGRGSSGGGGGWSGGDFGGFSGGDFGGGGAGGDW
jgi:uncharacterized protein